MREPFSHSRSIQSNTFPLHPLKLDLDFLISKRENPRYANHGDNPVLFACGQDLRFERHHLRWVRGWLPLERRKYETRTSAQ